MRPLATLVRVVNNLTRKHRESTTQHWVCLAIIVSLMSASVLLAARSIGPCGDAVFIGQVVSDRVVSITNVIHAERGVYMISKVQVVCVRVESVLRQDQRIPLRFPDEVLVYYNWYIRQAVQFSTGQRGMFYCNRGNLLGQTNVLILSTALDATAPF